MKYINLSELLDFQDTYCKGCLNSENLHGCEVLNFLALYQEHKEIEIVNDTIVCKKRTFKTSKQSQ